MPEGHTIHRAAREQRSILVGQTVRASSPQGRFAEAGELDRARLDAIEARGKHLLYRFTRRGRARTLHVHLGLAGKFRWHPSPPPVARGAVRLRLVAPARTLDLSGPLVCELIDPPAEAALLARLGPDPLAPRARPARMIARLARTRVPIGAMLLDQSVIAGLGNIYRAEVLFLAGVDPRRPSSGLTAPELAAIWRLSRELLGAGVEQRGKIQTLDPAIRAARRTWVYKQARCHRCGAAIEHAKLAGRPCYFCPRDQR